jgi:hypothetical protein
VEVVEKLIKSGELTAGTTEGTIATTDEEAANVAAQVADTAEKLDG